MLNPTVNISSLHFNSKVLKQPCNEETNDGGPIGCVSQARGEYWPTRILATYFEYEEWPQNKTTGATQRYMAMAIRAILRLHKLYLGNSAFAKYVANIRVGQYSAWPFDTQPLLVL